MSRILLLEDDTMIASGILYALETEGYETNHATGIKDAGSLIEHYNFDLAIIDMQLPDGTGFDVSEIFQNTATSVIFLTVVDDENTIVRAFDEGAEDYIVKPFEVLELLVRIEKVLARTKPEGHTLSVLNLEIDFEQHTVRQDGKEVSLKPMEFELLAVLAKNKNRAISRENLLRMVWGVEYMGETRTVDVHIGQLRKKLNLADHIKTVSKLGYRLEE